VGRIKSFSSSPLRFYPPTPCRPPPSTRDVPSGAGTNIRPDGVKKERGKRNRNRVPFQIFCVPTIPIAKLRTRRDFGKRTLPFKFLNGTRGHAEDTRVRISYGHCELTTNYESSYRLYQSFVFFIGVAIRFLSKMSNGTTKKSD
jgi:hypothetical protein